MCLYNVYDCVLYSLYNVRMIHWLQVAGRNSNQITVCVIHGTDLCRVVSLIQNYYHVKMFLSSRSRKMFLSSRGRIKQTTLSKNCILCKRYSLQELLASTQGLFTRDNCSRLVRDDRCTTYMNQLDRCTNVLSTLKSSLTDQFQTACQSTRKCLNQKHNMEHKGTG